MTYQACIDYLYQQLPMFQRIGNAAFKKSLHNTLVLCEALGNPQHTLSFVHVAGTNGKGSSSHMLAAALQEGGYKIGLYTSPHLKSFTERIKINGVEIPEAYVVTFVEQHRGLFDDLKPSFFEVTVAMAFRYFADQHVDLAVVEVGLGGRLDSTNILTPLVSLITNIGLDHQALLGDDLQSIAREKAGIIKPGIPAVITSTQNQVAAIFLNKAAEGKSALSFADQQYRIELRETDPYYQTVDVYRQEALYLPQLKLDLPGDYQRLNLPGVLKVLELLSEKGFALSVSTLREGLGQVRKHTNLKGRWQVLREKPLTICDTGHNADGIALVVGQLERLSYRSLHFVFGAVKDKDISGILALLPPHYTYYFCQPALPRALPVGELAQMAQEAGLHGNTYLQVQEAYDAARAQASAEDVIFIGGSTFVVAGIEEI